MLMPPLLKSFGRSHACLPSIARRHQPVTTQSPAQNNAGWCLQTDARAAMAQPATAAVDAWRAACRESNHIAGIHHGHGATERGPNNPAPAAEDVCPHPLSTQLLP